MRRRKTIGGVQDQEGREEQDLPEEAQVEAAVAAFSMPADATRLRLLWLLSRGEHDVGTLTTLVGTTASATSQHLAKLRLAGLVSVRGVGRRRVYSAHDTHVRRLIVEALHYADHRVADRPDHD